jgi:organic hydroperoxide reductase OsmC/OhrA
VSTEVRASFANLPYSAAGAGRIGTRMIVADRPEGKAGGQGLGFNGGELFAASLGGCFWNDLHYAADRLGVKLRSADVEAQLTLAGTPSRVVRARIAARLNAEPQAAARAVFDEAAAQSTIANSVMGAIPVTFELQGETT